jgi:hypothetical protein
MAGRLNGKGSSSCAAHPKHKTLGYSARSQLLYLARLPPKTPGGCELLINRTYHTFFHTVTYAALLAHSPCRLLLQGRMQTAAPPILKKKAASTMFCCCFLAQGISTSIARAVVLKSRWKSLYFTAACGAAPAAAAAGPGAPALLHPGGPDCPGCQPQRCLPSSWGQQRHHLCVGHSLWSTPAQLASPLQGTP